LRVHLVHGIHTEGATPIKGLVPFLVSAGFDVAYPDYGFILGIETRIVNPIIRGALLPYIANGDVLIGHSNGCAIAYDLLNAGAPACAAVFVNAALEQTITRPAGVRFIDVYFNRGDEITEAAKLAEQLGIVDPVWGEMGHAGYSGNDPQIRNIDCGSGIYGLPLVAGHSEFFDPLNLAAWGPYLAHRLLTRLRETEP
jgi:hypothetical protein